MTPLTRPAIILMAEDDPDDRLIAQESFERAKLKVDLRFVSDGQELLDYLRCEGDYETSETKRPDIILLDLNMPRMDGREALAEIKSDDALRRIPVVVLTSSGAEEDILRSYDLNANSYITKPVSFDGLIDVVQKLSGYWFQLVTLPAEVNGG